VAVSKTKPNELIQALYAQAGQRRFGENYVQELIRKATELPTDIEWHFIGHLQSRKVKSLVAVPNLVMVETVDSLKLAKSLNKEVANQRPAGTKLDVMLQVNTSGEESKSGTNPANIAALAKEVSQLGGLRLAGLMTIGRPDAGKDQPDFVTLKECRRLVAEALAVEETSLELSMGMSADFEDAISFGSTNIRVGSTIFGARSYASTS